MTIGSKFTGCLTNDPGYAAASRVRDANDEIRFAVVGFNGRGRDHISGLRKVKGTRLAALCDADRTVLDKEIKKCETAGERVEGYSDIRKLLENYSPEVKDEYK